MDQLLVAALYQFVDLPDYKERQDLIQDFCSSKNLCGTILLATEGINGTIAGPEKGVVETVEFLQNKQGFDNLELKYSKTVNPPFNRMKVRLKKEIVTMGVEGLDPKKMVGSYVPAEDWNKLIQDPDVLVIDTRNDYEVKLGTFRGAVNPELGTFRDFPDWLRAKINETKKSKIAMFCTGGIRCEKSTSFLKSEGLEDVFHLQGGILKYLETVSEQESLWDGQCFVFDQRVSVGHGLNRGEYELCFGCRQPISQEDKKSPGFEEGVSCPSCANATSEDRKNRFRERQKQIELKHQREKLLPALFSFRRCPYAMRARLALDASRFPVEHREIELKNRPPEIYEASPKGTVPVLILPDGTVLDESLDIMLHSLRRSDPESWLNPSGGSLEGMLNLIADCDGDFKFHLDRYKYSNRYEGADAQAHRSSACAFLLQLEGLLVKSPFLFGKKPALADMAVAPFVRQFSIADPEWFAVQEWPRLQDWLHWFTESPRFKRIMAKYTIWESPSSAC